MLTDPLLRRRVGPLHTPYPAPPAEVAGADLVLVSHAHHDHLDLPSLRRLTSGSTVVVPRGAGELVAGVTSGRVAELVVGESVEVRGLRVTGAPAVHPVSRRRGTPPVTPMGFLVTGGRTVYVAGDTDSFAGMADLAGADLALLPVGGWGPNLGPGHLDPRRAAEALRLLRPRHAVPVHWGSLRVPIFWRLNSTAFRCAGEAFRQHAADVAPGVVVTVARHGEPTRL